MHANTTIARAVRGLGICLIAGATALLTGCQTYDAALGSGINVTAIDSARLTRSGFLSYYARLKPVYESLLGQGVKAVVIACNTSTAHALQALRDASPVPVLGVIEPGAWKSAMAIMKGCPATCGRLS